MIIVLLKLLRKSKLLQIGSFNITKMALLIGPLLGYTLGKRVVTSLWQYVASLLDTADVTTDD